ncbi:MAG: PAS domain S-box protein [Candidatus Omnitrophota bacterium]
MHKLSHRKNFLSKGTLRGETRDMCAAPLEIFKDIFDYANDGMLLAEPKTKKIYLGNKSICQMLGYSLGELKKLTIDKIHPAGEFPYVLAQFEKIINKKITLAKNIPLLKKDKKILHVDIKGFMLNCGGKQYVAGIFRDITERHKLEAQLEKVKEDLELRVQRRTFELARTNVELQEEVAHRKTMQLELGTLKKQIEYILGATKTGLDIIDTEFNIRYIDPEWAKVYGEVQGRKCYQYFMGRNDICPGCGIVEALKTKQLKVTEEVLVKENNRPVQITTIPFQNENGEWLVAEVNVDISERKKTELALRESEEKFKTIFDNAGTAMVIADIETGNIIECNRQAQTLLGYSHEELVGMQQWQLHPFGQEEKYKEKFYIHAQRGRTEDIAVEVQHKNGTIVPVFLNAQTMHLAGRDIILGIFIEVDASL